MADQPGDIRFGVFEVNLAAGELRKNAVRVKLQEQPLQVLAALLERPGEIITKEELKARLWADDTFVDFDHGLSMAVNKIREALQDSAASPLFVETVPRRGYRFIGEISSAPLATPDASLEGPQAKPKSRRWFAWALGAAALVAVLGFTSRTRPVGPPNAPAAMRTVQLTSLPGRELYPSFSPDGTRVAFAWDGEDAGNFDIYVQIVGAGGPVPLTRHAADDLDPQWSPDGRYLAFARRSAPGRLELLRIPALGGQGRVLAKAADPSDLSFGTIHFLAWNRSADAIIFADRKGEGKPFVLYRYRLESGERTQLTDVPDNYRGDISPALSPDGKTLVFVRHSSITEGAIHTLELDAEGMPRSEPRQIASQPFYLFGPAFKPHSQEIVFSMWAPLPGLWSVALSGRTPPTRLAGITGRALPPNFSSDGTRMAYSRWLWDHDIWRLELSAAGKAAGPPKKWIYSTEDEEHSDYSRDGTKIAFMSNRSMHHQIWICNADGSDPEQLTSLDGSMSGTPRWSPDGRRVAFDSTASGRLDIYVINTNGSGLTRLTTGEVQGHSPRYSLDGRWIYFAGGRGQPGVWRIPADGGAAERIAGTLWADPSRRRMGAMSTTSSPIPGYGVFPPRVERNNPCWSRSFPTAVLRSYQRESTTHPRLPICEPPTSFSIVSPMVRSRQFGKAPTPRRTVLPSPATAGFCSSLWWKMLGMTC
jgi:Tol biopolymer transport system component/DNA-binding winged helix-turn-helix (wHTH) protein